MNALPSQLQSREDLHKRMQKLRTRALASEKKEVNVNESSSGASSADDDEEELEVKGNAGWADSIAKVLNTTKPKAKKTLVLSRAKKIKLTDVDKKTVDYGFEVEGDIPVEMKVEKKPDREELEKKTRKNMALALRVKPSWKDIERERALRKVATRGVVQLFNAVRMEQKDLQFKLEQAGPLDSRKEAVMNNINKKRFLDHLMGGKRAKSEAIYGEVKKEDDANTSDDDNDGLASGSNKKKSEWNVLRPDFMTNKKIKHWDEEDDDNTDSHQEGGEWNTDDDDDE